jgi:hypothetical protein
MMRRERIFQLIIRVMAVAVAPALVFVVAPYTWMDAIHQWLGLGILPANPVVGYLARSTSAFYALIGGLLWVISSDLPRNLPVLRYLGAATVVFGVTLFGVDWVEGLPAYWRWAEGPMDVIYGIAILWLSRPISRLRGPSNRVAG